MKILVLFLALSQDRRLLVQDARDLAARYAEEFSGTFLDGIISMLRRLADQVEEDGS